MLMHSEWNMCCELHISLELDSYCMSILMFKTFDLQALISVQNELNLASVIVIGPVTKLLWHMCAAPSRSVFAKDYLDDLR